MYLKNDVCEYFIFNTCVQFYDIINKFIEWGSLLNFGENI